MSTDPEVRNKKIIEMGESAEIVGLEILTRPLLLGLLISLEEQFNSMSDEVKEKHYEKGLEKIKELEQKALKQERKSKFYDKRFHSSWMSY
jgi:hypothetical protein